MIVAVADNNAIGLHGGLPWHIPEDLKFFKATTLGCPVIMGRRTWESLPFKPLKGRLNIVLSRSGAGIPGAVTAGSLEEAWEAASGAQRCFVMGGASVYADALGSTDTLYLTKVHTTIEGADAFFPCLPEQEWEESERSLALTDPGTGLEFEFITYRRRK